MGLGAEYASVAETEDSGLFFQWWDGIKVQKYGEVRLFPALALTLADLGGKTYTKYPRSAVHRARLLEVLHRSLPPNVTVHLGVRVHSVENLPEGQKARIHYTSSQPTGTIPKLNGGAHLATTTEPKEETFDADIVVAADGIKSIIRSVLSLPSPPESGAAEGKPSNQRYTGTYCYRALVPMAKAQELDVPEEGILAIKPKMVFGPGRHLTIFPIEQGTVGCSFPCHGMVLMDE